MGFEGFSQGSFRHSGGLASGPLTAHPRGGAMSKGLLRSPLHDGGGAGKTIASPTTPTPSPVDRWRCQGRPVRTASSPETAKGRG